MEVVALAVHPDGDVSDAGPGVEPGPQHPERAGSADGRESPANPSAATSRQPRWSSMSVEPPHAPDLAPQRESYRQARARDDRLKLAAH